MSKAHISPTCEVVVGDHSKAVPESCGKPTRWWYPVWGGGTMALCEEHAEPHRKSAAFIGLEPYVPEEPRDA